MRQASRMLAWGVGLSLAAMAMGDAAPPSETASAPKATLQQQEASARVEALLMAEDVETQARVSELLQFQEGLASWTTETLKLPEGQAKAQLDFCLKPEVMSKISGLFTQDAEKRVRAARVLAKYEDAAAEGVLLRLLGSRDRNIALVAVDAIKSHKPTAESVSVLWDRGVEDLILINGMPFARKGGDPRRCDMNVATKACDVLEAWKSPYANVKLKEFMERVEKYFLDQKNANAVMFFSDKHPPMSGVCDLLRANKPAEAVPALLRIVGGKSFPGGNLVMKGNMVVGGRKNAGEAADDKELTSYFWTSRTLWIAMLVEITRQSTGDYGLKRCALSGNQWSFSTSEDEEKAIKRLQEWWKEHEKDYAGGAATQPAEKERAP